MSNLWIINVYAMPYCRNHPGIMPANGPANKPAKTPQRAMTDLNKAGQEPGPELNTVFQPLVQTRFTDTVFHIPETH
jgi:hypothetical protein